MPAKDRVLLAAQLHPQKDADLIAWSKTIPDGHMNQAIKTMLRVALKDGAEYHPTTQPTHSDNSVLERRVEELERHQALLVEELNRYHGQLPTYIAQLIQQQTGAAPPAIEAEVTQRIDDETKRQRKENRKKNQW